MPGWLKTFGRINPLTYEVDGMRALMMRGGSSLYGICLDIIVLAITSIVLTHIVSYAYPHLAH